MLIIIIIIIFLLLSLLLIFYCVCADACTDRDVCIFFVGSSMIAVHEQQGPGNAYAMWSGTTESEGFDRTHIRLPGSQEEIIKVPSPLLLCASLWGNSQATKDSENAVRLLSSVVNS